MVQSGVYYDFLLAGKRDSILDKRNGCPKISALLANRFSRCDVMTE